MELAVADVVEDTGYSPCMFCTARCFKLHGNGGRSSKGHASRSLTVHAALPGPEKVSSSKHRKPFFVKTVGTSTVRSNNSELHLPAFFFRDYGDRFQKFVLLRGPSGQVWPVNLCISCGSSSGRPTVRFSRGWNSFALDHDLELGDKLIFTLIAFSRFTVQVFDTLGKKKPTSSMAISGWSFQLEGLLDGEIPRKKSFQVNWTDKVVRESAVEESKKGKVIGNRHNKASLLYRHFKREKTRQEKNRGAIVKFRPPKHDRTLPRPGVRLLGPKRMKQIDNACSEPESLSSSQDFAGEDEDITKLLDGTIVQWEPPEKPPENGSLALTWPSSDEQIDFSANLHNIQQFRNPVKTIAKPRTIEVKASALKLSPPSRSRYPEDLPNSRKDDRNIGDVQEGRGDPMDVNCKYKDTGLVSLAKLMSLPTEVFQVAPIRALENPTEPEIVSTPASPTISLSHYLEMFTPKESAHENRENTSLVVHHSQTKSAISSPINSSADQMEEHIEATPGIRSEKPDTTLGEDLGKIFSQEDACIISDFLGQSILEEHAATLQKGRDDEGGSQGKCAAESDIKSLHPQNQACPLGRSNSITGASESAVLPTPATTRSDDLSFVYFLYQPRPNVRSQTIGDNSHPLGKHQGENSMELTQTAGAQVDQPSAPVDRSANADHKADSTTRSSLMKTSAAASASALLRAYAGSFSDGEETRNEEQSRSDKESDDDNVQSSQVPPTKTIRCPKDQALGIKDSITRSPLLNSSAAASASALLRAHAGSFSDGEGTLNDEQARSTEEFDDGSVQLSQVPPTKTAGCPKDPLGIKCLPVSPSIPVDVAPSTLLRAEDALLDGEETSCDKREEIERECDRKNYDTCRLSPSEPAKYFVEEPPDTTIEEPPDTNSLPADNPTSNPVDVEFGALSLSPVANVNLSQHLDRLRQIKGQARRHKRNGRHEDSFSKKKICFEKGASQTQRKSLFSGKPTPQKDTLRGASLYPPANLEHESTFSQDTQEKQIACMWTPRMKKRVSDGGSHMEQSKVGVDPDESVAKRNKALVSRYPGMDHTSMATRTIRDQIVIQSDPKASSSPPGEKLQKLRPTWTYTQHARITHKEISKRDKCELTELEDIKSDDDESEQVAKGGEESWNSWMNIFRQNSVAS